MNPSKADRLVEKEREARKLCCGKTKTCTRDCDFAENVTANHPHNPYWNRRIVAPRRS